MDRRLAIAALTFALFGCASAPPSPPSDASYVVVSMIGEKLKLKQVGITVFGNADKVLDVSSWNVDARSQEAAVRALTAAGRTVRPTRPEASLEIGPWTYTNFTSAYVFKGGPSAFKNVASQSKADFVVVLLEISSNFGDPFFGTNQSTAGYGVYQRKGRGAILFADLAILLVDGKTGEVLSRRRSYGSAPRPDTIRIDIESSQPTLNDLGQSAESFLTVINDTVKQGLEYHGLLPRK